MLRIHETRTPDGLIRIEVEGDVSDPEDLAELSRVTHVALRAGSVAIGLRRVARVSPAGRVLLRSLRERGVRLDDCSAWLAALIA